MDSHPYTCVTCSLAWPSSQAQRAHFQTDLHRYNSKRKVAGLQPISAEVFNDKIAERRDKLTNATKPSDENRLTCKACNKMFSNENVYNDHLKSRKHRETVLRGVKDIKVDSLATKAQSLDLGKDAGADVEMEASASTSKSATPSIPPSSCLFCTRSFETQEVALKHMANNHAFYIPDQSYCADVPGLIAHLAQDIALGNVCIYCGHGFGGHVTGSESDLELVKRAKRGLEAVRGHMTAKNHCRIPWDTDDQRLELSDYYNYESSYPDYKAPENGMDADEGDGLVEDDDWEDDDESEIDEDDEVVMDYSAIRRKIMKPMEDDLDQRIRIGESDYELVLPSGAKIGHRALRGVYKQNVMPYVDLDSSKDKVARLANALEARTARRDFNSSALVPRKEGLPMIVARNAGEAKEARKTTKMFKEQRRFNDHKLRIGKVHNNQKHFRDPLLQ